MEREGFSQVEGLKTILLMPLSYKIMRLSMILKVKINNNRMAKPLLTSIANRRRHHPVLIKMNSSKR
jgi:hypothetical protein